MVAEEGERGVMVEGGGEGRCGVVLSMLVSESSLLDKDDRLLESCAFTAEGVSSLPCSSPTSKFLVERTVLSTGEVTTGWAAGIEVDGSRVEFMELSLRRFCSKLKASSFFRFSNLRCCC